MTEKKGKIEAVCISEKKGTVKENVGKCLVIRDYGLQNDAHAGSGRQVSLLSLERVKEAEESIRKLQNERLGEKLPVGEDAGGITELKPGVFGENILASGIDFKSLRLGTVFEIGQVRLELMQIGKKCHTGCKIQVLTGKCIMPSEGVFARVLEGGEISVGDEIKVVYEPKFTAATLTASDRSFAGKREDLSTSEMKRMLNDAGYYVAESILLPDEKEGLEKELKRLCDEIKPDVVFTSGGTGLSPRDCMPEATLSVAEKNVPGIAEAIRNYSMTITPKAMLSRAVSVMRGRTLIINLPGSPKAVNECLGFILPTLEHGILIMRGEGDA